jgi:FecR-like protein
MNRPLKPDPGWSRLLEEALPGEPRPGAEERVLRGVRERLASELQHAERRSSGVAATGDGRARARRWLAALAIAATCALLVFAVQRWQRASTPALGQRATAAASASNSTGAVETGTSERALTLGDGVRLLVRSGTRLRWQEAGDGSECWLDEGSVLVNVPEGYGRRFRVHTASTQVEVTGTVFGVEQRGVRSSVTVWHGSVHVTRAAEQTNIVAGQHWPREAPSLQASATDLERIGALDRVQAPLAGAASDAGAPDLDRDDTASSEALPPPGAPSGTAHEPVPTLDVLAQRYREARELESHGERARAADLYTAVAHSTGSEAEAATFAAARLRHGLGQHEAARRLLETYRNRFPNGSYARAVDVLLLRVHLARNDSAAVEREANAFLIEHAGDPRAPQFRWARARSLASRGRCSEALAERALLEPARQAELQRLCPD